MPNITGTVGDDTIVGTDDPDTISGLAGDDIILGGGGDDLIDGGDDDDALDGGIGADMLTGGAGDDVYYLDNLGDRVFELGGGGFDTVYTTVDYGLGANVERLAVLVPSSTFAINLNGNDLNNEMWGNAGANYLNGFAGVDILRGLAGDDTYIVDNVGDVVVESDSEGMDTVYTSASYVLSDHVERLFVNGFSTTSAINLTGNASANELIGNDGANVIDGGAGADTMRGHGGADIYYADDSADLIVESVGGGMDTVYTSVDYVLPDNVERLFVKSPGTGSNLRLTGNELANEINGNNGANVIDGRGGADIMRGNDGDDIYYVDNANDVLVESATGGNDLVFTTVSYVLGAGSSSNFAERLFVLDPNSTDPINLTGNQLDNEIHGNNGNNVLDGGQAPPNGGFDILIGFGGDDTYRMISSPSAPLSPDLVVEAENGGHDNVVTNFSYTLPENVEDLSGRGTLTGNALDNVITGSTVADIIDGRAGADTMRGGAGNDTYFIDNAGDTIEEGNNSGSDTVYVAGMSYTLGTNFERLSPFNRAGVETLTLTGNASANEIWGNEGANAFDGLGGADILRGGGGADSFAFTTALGGGNVDQLISFEIGSDKILLDHAIFTGLPVGALAPNEFALGTAEDRPTGDLGHIVYNSATGALYFDADGRGGADGVQFATVHEGLPLSASDFMVI